MFNCMGQGCSEIIEQEKCLSRFFKLYYYILGANKITLIPSVFCLCWFLTGIAGVSCIGRLLLFRSASQLRLRHEGRWKKRNTQFRTKFWWKNMWKNKHGTWITTALRLLTPPMETPDPPNDTPGALKQVVLTPHGILWSLREYLFLPGKKHIFIDFSFYASETIWLFILGIWHFDKFRGCF